MSQAVSAEVRRNTPRWRHGAFIYDGGRLRETSEPRPRVGPWLPAPGLRAPESSAGGPDVKIWGLNLKPIMSRVQTEPCFRPARAAPWRCLGCRAASQPEAPCSASCRRQGRRQGGIPPSISRSRPSRSLMSSWNSYGSRCESLFTLSSHGVFTGSVFVSRFCAGALRRLRSFMYLPR